MFVSNNFRLQYSIYGVYWLVQIYRNIGLLNNNCVCHVADGRKASPVVRNYAYAFIETRTQVLNGLLN